MPRARIAGSRSCDFVGVSLRTPTNRLTTEYTEHAEKFTRSSFRVFRVFRGRYHLVLGFLRYINLPLLAVE